MKSSAQSTVSLPGDVLISSWEELQSKLYEGSWQGHLERFRSPFAFRGIPNANSPPETGLCRLGGEYVRCEQSLLRNFRKYAHRNAIHSIPFGIGWHWHNILVFPPDCSTGLFLLTWPCISLRST